MRLDHVNIRCTSLDATRDFLIAVVGLRPGWRPPFDFAGHWLVDDDNRPVVHLIAAPGALGEAGAVDHVAFYFDDLGAQLQRLQAQGLRLLPVVVPGTPIHQCFINGPDGLTVELQGPLAPA